MVQEALLSDSHSPRDRLSGLVNLSQIAGLYLRRLAVRMTLRNVVSCALLTAFLDP